MGGIAGVDITMGLPRAEEVLEARPPKGEAIISEVDGEVQEITSDKRVIIKTNLEKPKNSRI